jgi:hypothetical protein
MRNNLNHCLAVLFFAAGASACGSGATNVEGGTQSGGPGATSTGGSSSGGGDGCAIDAIARKIIEETVLEQTYAARDVAKNAGEKTRGFAVQIPASKFGYVGLGNLVTACPDDTVIARCQSTQNPPPDEFWKTHDACVRFSCQKDTKIAIVDTFLTMVPKKEATDRHKFTYDTTGPAGTAIYDPNPFMTWKVDLTDLSAIKVSGDIEANVKITPTEGSLFDFKHKGTATATRAGDAVDSVTLELEFTGLFLAGDPPITASAALDAANKASGTVMSGDEVLADIDMAFDFDWHGACASAP